MKSRRVAVAARVATLSVCAAIRRKELIARRRRTVLTTQPHPPMRSGDLQAVYVIDDDASIRRSVSRLLTSSNLTVRTFDSGETFLAELGKLSQGCLIVDVDLKGMSGLELVRQMTSAYSAWPIIVMSGSHDKKAASEAVRLGARAYLRKPFDSQALLDTIAALP